MVQNIPISISKFVELEPIKISKIFWYQKEINTSVVEDEIKVFFLDELNVSDPNDNQWIQNLSITEAPGHGYASYRYQGDDSMSLTFENESKAKEALKTAELRYFPDANYSGADEFIISATRTSGLPTFLKIVVRVESLNDAPAFSSSLPSVIQLQERNEEVIRLIGEDADTLDKETLKFS